MSLLESSHRMHPKYLPVARPPCLSRQRTTTGGCPDDVVVGIQSPDAPKYPPVARPPVPVPTMSLLESSHRMHQNICRLQGLHACPYNGQPQGVVPTWVPRRCRCWNPITGCTKISAGCKAPVPVPTMSLLESSHRMHQNIRRLQGPRACPYNGQPQGVVPTWVSRRCRCWNPVTGCTKISAGCKAPVPVPIMDNHRGLSRRGCPDDVVVGIQSPDAPKYPPVARPPCLSRREWTTTGGCPDDVFDLRIKFPPLHRKNH